MLLALCSKLAQSAFKLFAEYMLRQLLRQTDI